MSKIKGIGIIAEDSSDYESSKAIIKRIINKKNITFKKAIGNGCGKLRRKALDYAVDLKKRGCNLIIVIHDLDRNDLNILRTELEKIVDGCSKIEKFVCIPVEELEAWFLSDPAGLKDALKLKRVPSIKRPPETITSPKEFLRDLIFSCSDKEKIYINTKHNELISQSISLELMKQKCPSFQLLFDYVSELQFTK